MYLLFLFFLLQSKGVPAEENVYRDLVDKGVATYEDGCLAISYFAGIPVNTMTFDEVVAALKEKRDYRKAMEIQGGQAAYARDNGLYDMQAA